MTGPNPCKAYEGHKFPFKNKVFPMCKTGSQTVIANQSKEKNVRHQTRVKVALTTQNLIEAQNRKFVKFVWVKLQLDIGSDIN